MDLIKKQFNNQEITFDLSGEGMINATEMAKANGKLIANFFENKETKEYLEALSSDIGIPISELYVSKKGGSIQGTWVHRRLAIRIAQWCNPKFAVWVDRNIEDIFNGKSNNDALVREYQELSKLSRELISNVTLLVNHYIMSNKNPQQSQQPTEDISKYFRVVEYGERYFGHIPNDIVRADAKSLGQMVASISHKWGLPIKQEKNLKFGSVTRKYHVDALKEAYTKFYN